LVLEEEIHNKNGYFELHACDQKGAEDLKSKLNTFNVNSHKDRIRELHNTQATLTSIEEDFIYYDTTQENT